MRSAAEAAVLSTAALLLSLLVFGGFVALRGVNPLEVFRALLFGAFGNWFAVQFTLTQAAPLMLTGLCTAIPARAGMLVIGGEGALVMGGVVTALAGVLLAGAPPLLGIPAIALAGAAGGAAWIAVAGALRQWRGVNETISTLLLNYIAIALMNHLVSGPIRDFAQVLKPASWSIPEGFRLGDMPGTSVHWGLAVGMMVCVLTWILLRKTTFGFAIDVLGGNLRAAQLAGLPVTRLVLLTTAMAGAAAGLAGAMEVMAVHGFASASLAVGFGYTGILVAFLARQNPLAVVFVSVVLGGISASGGLLQRRFGLPDAATLVLRGVLFIMVLASSTLYGRFRMFRDPER